LCQGGKTNRLATTILGCFGKDYLAKGTGQHNTGAFKKNQTATAGIIMFGLIWDGTHLAIGAIFGTSLQLTPVEIAPYFLQGLACLFVLAFAGQQIAKHAFRIGR